MGAVVDADDVEMVREVSGRLMESASKAKRRERETEMDSDRKDGNLL
jgi:hypothetical protein